MLWTFLLLVLLSKFGYGDENPPVKIEASLIEGNHQPYPQNSLVHIKIINLSKTRLPLGRVHNSCSNGLDAFISDNPVIDIPLSIVPDCGLSNSGPFDASWDEGMLVFLNSGKIYEEDRVLNYKGEGSSPVSVSFRVGLKGSGTTWKVWSNPIRLRIIGGITHAERPLRKLPLNGVIKTFYLGEEQDNNYKDGKLDGHSRYYDGNGKLEHDVLFTNGKSVRYVSYEPDGSVAADLKKMDMEWRNGQYVPIFGRGCLEPDTKEPSWLRVYPKCKN